MIGTSVLVLLLALIVSTPVHAQDPDDDPEEVQEWPTSWTALPTIPPAGWVTCEGYPERRNYVEGQWWDSKSGIVDQSRHIHVGVCVPEQVQGIVRFDVRIVTFHWGGAGAKMVGLYKSGFGGARVMLPAPLSPRLPGRFHAPLTEHLHEFYVPMLVDTRVTARGKINPDGVRPLLLGIDVQRQDENNRPAHHLLTVRIPIRFANGEGRAVVTTDHGAVSASGWETAWREMPDGGSRERNIFGYLIASVLNYDPLNKTDKKWTVRRFADDVATNWNVKGNGFNGRTLTLFASVNPDMHQHPPRLGGILVNEVPLPRSGMMPVYPPGDMAPGDSLFVRVTDDQAGNPDGTASTVVVIRLGPPKDAFEADPARARSYADVPASDLTSLTK